LVTVIPTLRRDSYHFNAESFSEDVKRYLTALEEAKELLKNSAWTVNRLLLNDSSMEKNVMEEIEREIKYCKFYLDLQERQSNESLNQWVFNKKEDIEQPDYYREPTGEQWVKSNGRIKAIIQFDRTKKMVGLEVKFKNDNQILNFYDSYYDNENLSRKSHLKSPESINERVEEYKAYADEVMKNRLFPKWNQELNNFHLLQKLLVIKEAH